MVIGDRPTPAVRLGSEAIDLRACAAAGIVPGGPWADAAVLNPLLAGGAQLWADVRGGLLEALSADRVPPAARHALSGLPQPLLPVAVGDLVDGYASLHHATAVGRLFRPEEPDPLPAAWRHLPIGYHGRAGSVVVSGTDVVRPRGLVAGPVAGAPPVFGPSAQLDLELEVAAVVGGPPTGPGEVLDAAAAEARLFGVALLDDWSARDVQAYEYRPLGPNLGKAFLTSIAAWITPMAALEAARVPAPVQDPPVAAHLAAAGGTALDLDLTWSLAPAGTDDEVVVGRARAAELYWTAAQQLVHLASGGAVVRPGDLIGSGTVSGPGPGEQGCLLERTRGGRDPVAIGGTTRTWLEDGDRVVLRGSAPAVGGGRLQLAECAGTVRPARAAGPPPSG